MVTQVGQGDERLAIEQTGAGNQANRDTPWPPYAHPGGSYVGGACQGGASPTAVPCARALWLLFTFMPSFMPVHAHYMQVAARRGHHTTPPPLPGGSSTTSCALCPVAVVYCHVHVPLPRLCPCSCSCPLHAGGSEAGTPHPPCQAAAAPPAVRCALWLVAPSSRQQTAAGAGCTACVRCGTRTPSSTTVSVCVWWWGGGGRGAEAGGGRVIWRNCQGLRQWQRSQLLQVAVMAVVCSH
jgi:hypothetical protein